MANPMFKSFVYFVTLLLFFSGCATKVLSPRFIISKENQRGEFYGPRSWKKTLEKYVDVRGRTAFKKLT
jgi:hypothetical protein